MSGAAVRCPNPRCGAKLGARRGDWALAVEPHVGIKPDRDRPKVLVCGRCGREFRWWGRVVWR